MLSGKPNILTLGNPLQYHCLENSMDRGTWQAAFHGVANSQPRLSTSESMYVPILPLITRLFTYFCNREVFNARSDPSTLLSTRGLEVNKPEHFSEEGITIFWLVKVKLHHSVMSYSLQPHRLYSPWNSSGQNTGVGSLSLLQEINPTQGSNLGLLHCRWILYQLRHKGSPRILEWVSYFFSSGSS